MNATGPARLVTVTLFVAALAACDDGTPGSVATVAVATSTTPVVAAPTEPVPDSASVARSTDLAPPPTAVAATTGLPIATTAPPPPSGPLAGVLATRFAVLTPPSGNGHKPLLAWEPVAGATSYDVVVSTTDGAPYWAWRGGDPQVWMGGSVSEPSPDTEGPVLVEPVRLTVFASDADGRLLAMAGPAVIAP